MCLGEKRMVIITKIPERKYKGKLGKKNRKESKISYKKLQSYQIEGDPEEEDYNV